MELQINYFKTLALGMVFLALGFSGCKKLVDIPEPVNTITTSETFSNAANAESAIVQIYNDLVTYQFGLPGYGNGLSTLLGGLSSDELNYFIADLNVIPYQDNNLQSTRGFGYNFWTEAYYDIYLANAAIEGLQASTTISDSVKNQLIGEAKFFRAFGHFYLVNFFGDVPLITTTAWAHTATLPRTPVSDVYQQVIADLIDAQKLLISDYSNTGGERVRANKWAATALLARVYLYTGRWAEAEAQASSVIGNTGLFSLVSDLNGVFLKNSNEAILQLQVNSDKDPFTTIEATQIIPYDSTTNPTFFLTSQLLGAFEPGDQRRVSWLDSTDYSGTYYLYPFKYKVLFGQQGDVAEYYMVLRLAEQYLIRAEARAQQNELPAAIGDLNTIRERAGLPDLSLSLTQPEVLAAVVQERRIELFAEWGHRWLDLKRTGQADAVLQPIKPQWKSSAQLYPIPQQEIQTDPNLVQNPGY